MKLVFCLIIGTLLFTNEEQNYINATIANEPSTVIDNCVSAITGGYFINAIDCHLHAAESYTIKRMYISTSQWGKQPYWNLLPHLKASKSNYPKSSIFYTREPNGTFVEYNEGIPLVGSGVCHSGYGTYNIANNRLEEKKQEAIVYAADGTERHYTFNRVRSYLLLTKERLPNGNLILYDYKDSANPNMIEVYNPSQTKCYIRLRFVYENWGKDGAKIHIYRNGRKQGPIVTYEYKCKVHKKHKYNYLSKVYSYQNPLETISYTQKGKRETFFVNTRDFTEGHLQKVHYYHVDTNSNHPSALAEKDPLLHEKTHSLENPLHKSYTFEYAKNATTVRDALRNKTTYDYGYDSRLKKITKYRENIPYYEQTYKWSTDGDLLQKTIIHNSLPYQTTTYDYDEYHNIISETIIGNPQTDSLLRIQKTQYKYTYANHKHLLTEKSEAKQVTTTYTYFKETNLPSSIITKHKNTIIKEEFFTYNDDHILIAHTEKGPGKEITTKIEPKNNFPALGLPKSISTFAGNALLSRIDYTYNNSNLPLTETHYDANNNYLYTIEKTYDKHDRLIATSDPLQRTTHIKLDTHSNPIEITNEAEGYTITNTYDKINRLLTTTKHTPEYPAYTETIEYDALSRPICQTTPQGDKTHITYDDTALKTTTTLPPIHGKPPTIITQYDFLERPTAITDPLGNTTHTRYDSFGAKTAIIYPDNTQETFTYTSHGHLRTHTLPNQTTILYKNDYIGRPLAKKVIAKDKTTPHTIDTYTYDTYNLISHTNPANITTHFTYDLAGRQTSERTKDALTQTEYNAQSLPYKIITYTDHNQARIHLTEYNLLGNPTKETETDLTNHLYSQTTYTYDTHDNIQSKTNHPDITTHYTYDTLHRPLTETNNLNQTTTHSYDDHNRITTYTDLKNRTLTTHTDAHGNRIRTEMTHQNTLLARHDYTYDLASNKTDLAITVCNPSRTIYRHWDYDTRSRPITFIDGVGSPTPKTTRTTYTPTGKIRTLTKPDGSTLTYTYDALDNNTRITAPNIDYSYTYDTLSQVTLAQDNITGTETTRTYDSYGNITRETLANNLTIARTYDLASRPRTITYPDNTQTTYTYNPYHLTTLTRNQHTIQYQYNQHHQITSAGDQTYTYDALSRLTSITSPYHSDTIHTYDLTSNPTARTINSTTYTYTYDIYDHLITEPYHTYTYDSLHNRTTHNSTSYNYNALNQNTAQPHDQNGNLLENTIPGYFYSTTHNYTYDALDRLATLNDISLTYDPFHRLISYGNTNILYDHDLDIGTYHNTTQTSLRILGPTPLAEIGATALIELAADNYNVYHDAFGNIHHLASPLSSHTFDYTAYGSTHDHPCPWQYQGKRTISSHTAFGRRFYFPDTGRFLNPDPAGYTDAPNLYHYLLSSPLSHHDPWGLYVDPATPEFWNNFTEASHENFQERLNFNPLLSEQPTFSTKTEARNPLLLPERILEIPVDIRREVFNNPHFGLEWGKHSGNGLLPIIGSGMTTSRSATQEISRTASNILGEIPLIYYTTSTKTWAGDLGQATNGMLGTELPQTPTLYNILKSAIANSWKCSTSAHSKGAIPLYQSLNKLSSAERQKIDAFTYGGARFIPSNWTANSKNYYSEIDFVPQIIHATSDRPLIRSAQWLAGKICGIAAGRNYNTTQLPACSLNPLYEHGLKNPTYWKPFTDNLQSLRVNR